MALVSKSEAARLVGVTRQTIHRKIKSGELSATGNEIDTSELIRVFGAISDGTQPVTSTLQPDAAVQATLQARVDGLESQLAVTREQLADTARDRDEWREIAKEATSNVKLITNQESAPKNNDNIAIFVAGAFALGLLVTAMYFMTQQGEPVTITPEPVTETQPKTPKPITSFEQFVEETGIDFNDLVAVPVEESEQPDGIDFSKLEAIAKEQAEKGANEYAEFVPPPAQVPRTVCSIYDINPFSKYNNNECGLYWIDYKLKDRVRLQDTFPDNEFMRITPAEELASQCLNDGLLGDEWLNAKCPEAMLELAEMYGVELHENELSGKPSE